MNINLISLSLMSELNIIVVPGNGKDATGCKDFLRCHKIFEMSALRTLMVLVNKGLLKLSSTFFIELP